MPHKLEGYIIDLLDEMEKVPEMEDAGIEFHATPVEDGKYGSYNATKQEWNGMIKSLIDGVRESMMYSTICHKIHKI